MVDGVQLRREVATTPFEVPEGSTPIGCCHVADAPATLLLAFPPGWQRERSGHYLDAEEFIVLGGAMAMNEEVHRPGTWVLVPGRTLREATRTPEGALAVVWFDDGMRWSTDPRAAGDRSSHVDLTRAARASGRTPFGPGRALRRRRSWFVNELRLDHPEVVRQVLATDAEGAPTLWTAQAGEALPPIAGPCFVRTTSDLR